VTPLVTGCGQTAPPRDNERPSQCFLVSSQLKVTFVVSSQLKVTCRWSGRPQETPARDTPAPHADPKLHEDPG